MSDQEAPTALRLPPGTRPDKAEAIEWLMKIPGPVTVAVDGWNVAFQFKTAPGKKERHQVEAAVGRLTVRAAGKRRLMVVFDSRFAPEGTSTGTHPRVEVQFPRSADDMLIELASKEERLVVISSDRRVREEAGKAGAVPLWGEALIEWLR